MATASDKQDAAPPIEEEAPFPLFKESLSYQAQLLARFTQNDYMARITGTGIAPAQAYVLGELWFDAPLSQVELARRLDIGKATIGQTLTRLERAGVVERKRVAADRRVVMVHLTEEGRRLREPLRVAAIDQSDMLEDKLGKDKATELTELLKQVNQLLGSAWPHAVAD
ncbi:MarR family winged helix-turn-helix transcriptional regulator [Sphingobium yanoikuyae]|uniref:MarR family winged helix-turn-helix transcriptional regulator n=1 Tax=Sphingobium yanoikuyae TaxID=13690 RepID=UPI0026F21E20|nr:MarR family transcriptional regulator [Sphingobium yanoikuyae]